MDKPDPTSYQDPTVSSYSTASLMSPRSPSSGAEMALMLKDALIEESWWSPSPMAASGYLMISRISTRSPSFREPIEISPGASKATREEGGGIVAVSISHKLTSAEQQYAIIDRESLATKWEVEVLSSGSAIHYH